MKRKYSVKVVPNSGEQSYSMSGPFVVRARNPLHAARLVRHHWPAYVSNHVSVETRRLAVREYGDQESAAFISDRRGKLIPSAARFYKSVDVDSRDVLCK